MIKLKEYIQRAKAFINENPQRKKFLLIIFILAIIPLTVLAALTVQDLRQRAGGGNGIQILDASGNFISTTSDTNVRLRITLPENWASLGMTKNNLISQVYAQAAQCSPPYQGFLGCFRSSDSPSGSVCTSSCITDDGQSGEWCYNSTTVGNSCTNSAGQSGICSEQGACVASAVSTPTPTPSSPQSTANCGKQTCSISETCIGSSFDNSTFCLTKGTGAISSYCGTPSRLPNSEACSSGFCDSTLRCATVAYPTPTFFTPTPPLPTSGISPTSAVPTSTPMPIRLNALRIENKDNDGSSGGSDPINVFSDFNGYISTPLSWKLNDLLPEQNQAIRVVQVTLFSNTGESITLSASVNLVRPKNGPANSAQLSPHVYILEDDGTFDKSDSASITKKFYEKYPDQYDFIGIHYKDGALGGNTYGYKVQDAVQQGGVDGKVGKFVAIPDGKGGWITADRLATFGSKGKLLGGYVDSFNFNKMYVERDPNNDAIYLIDDVYFSLLFHELTHYWGVNLPDELKEANHYNWATKEYDRTHWEPFVASWISGGYTTRNQLIEKEGKFYLKKDCSKEPKHHDFDLYSMGLKSLEEIKDKLVIIKPYNELPYGPSAPCDTSVELSKDFIRKTYTIQDFINILGPRIPSVADAQKDFTIAFVMIVPKGETLSQKQLDALNWVADKFPITWYKSTEGRSTLNGIKPKDMTKPIISNVKTSATKSSIKVSWTTNEPASSFVIYDRYASFIYPYVITNPPKFSTSHEINIESSDQTPLSPNTEYPVKILSIDEDYNMASFDAGKIITTDTLSSITPPASGVPVSQTVGSSGDLNKDEKINCKDVPIIIDQYGQKGTNLSADLDHNGIVDGIDYNIIVRNYTPGDTTVCAQ